jgi:gas vesicle protein
MRWLKVWLIVGLLVGAIIPAGAALAESGSETLPPEIQDNTTTNTTEMQIVAEHIISNIEKLHNITSKIMEEANFTSNSTIIENYQRACLLYTSPSPRDS